MHAFELSTAPRVSTGGRRLSTISVINFSTLTLSCFDISSHHSLAGENTAEKVDTADELSGNCTGDGFRLVAEGLAR